MKKRTSTDEQIKGFNRAFNIVKAKGFENYFCLQDTTWKEAKQRFDNGMVLVDEWSIYRLNTSVEIVLAMKRGETIHVCKTCKMMMNPQEYKAGYRECEHCERNNKNKSALPGVENAN